MISFNIDLSYIFIYIYYSVWDCTGRFRICVQRRDETTKCEVQLLYEYYFPLSSSSIGGGSTPQNYPCVVYISKCSFCYALYYVAYRCRWLLVHKEMMNGHKQYDIPNTVYNPFPKIPFLKSRFFFSPKEGKTEHLIHTILENTRHDVKIVWNIYIYI